MVAESLESAYRRHAVELIRYATVMVGAGDIAGVLGVSEGTVRKQLARARARLREVLDD